MKRFVLALTVLYSSLLYAAQPDAVWKTHSPREEISPKFELKNGVFKIDASGRNGATGQWQTRLAIKGGQHYRFFARRSTHAIKNTKRHVVERLIWLNAKGNKVVRDEPSFASYRPGTAPRAEPEFPRTRGPAKNGWTEVSDIFRAPKAATQVQVELSLRWQTNGRVEWRNVSLLPTAAPKPRVARLATIHFQPRAGKTNNEKCRLFASLIAEAAKKEADFVVLPETLTFYRSGRSYVECAEPIPGPSTKYFGTLAKKLAQAGTPKRTIQFMATAGHFYGSIGTIEYIRQNRESLDDVVAEIHIEHIALEAKEKNGELVMTGATEPAAVFTPYNRACVRMVKDFLVAQDLKRTLVLGAHGPLGEFPPTDGGDFHLEGVPVFNYICNPVYLLVDDDDLSKVDWERLVPVRDGFYQLIGELNGCDPTQLRKTQYPLKRALASIMTFLAKRKTKS